VFDGDDVDVIAHVLILSGARYAPVVQSFRPFVHSTLQPEYKDRICRSSIDL